MKVFVIKSGFLGVDLNRLVAMSVAATPANKTIQARWIDVPVYCLYVKHPNGNFMFDLGCTSINKTDDWPEHLKNTFSYSCGKEDSIEAQLKSLSVSPLDISTVILSHLHFDHIGNIELFKHADVYVPKEDFMHAMSLIHMSTEPSSHKSYIKKLIETPVKQYHLIENDIDFLPSVEIVTLPGHTPGILGLVLHLENDGTLIFPSDSSYLADNYGPPAKLPSNIYDSRAYMHSIEKIRRLQKKYNAKIMFSHDMDYFHKMKKIPEYYC